MRFFTAPAFLDRIEPMFKAVPKAAILSMVGPMALLLAGYLGWRFYGANALDTAYYALKQENNLSSDKIVVGQQLAIPSK